MIQTLIGITAITIGFKIPEIVVYPGKREDSFFSFMLQIGGFGLIVGFFIPYYFGITGWWQLSLSMFGASCILYVLAYFLTAKFSNVGTAIGFILYGIYLHILAVVYKEGFGWVSYLLKGLVVLILLLTLVLLFNTPQKRKDQEQKADAFDAKKASSWVAIFFTILEALNLAFDLFNKLLTLLYP
jgi:hypothetical protein